MKTVVITGSARGFGYAMLELFYKNSYNVVMVDKNEEAIDEAVSKLSLIDSNAVALTFNADITKEEDVKTVINETIAEFKTIDIWINNAGINQPNRPIWDLEMSNINKLISNNLGSTILCSKLIIPVMVHQGSGAIYNVEGHGSNDNTITGLSIYGTTKRAVTYFNEALIHEIKDLQLPIIVGKIQPGIMITDFIHHSLGEQEEIELSKKTKKVYNILGDSPETVAKFMVEKIIQNKKNGVKFTWLTNGKAFWRFITYPFNKRNFFD